MAILAVVERGTARSALTWPFASRGRAENRRLWRAAALTGPFGRAIWPLIGPGGVAGAPEIGDRFAQLLDIDVEPRDPAAIADHLPSEAAAAFREAYGNLLAEGEGFSLAVTTAGSRRAVRLTGRLVNTESDEIGVCLEVTDVTAEAEEQAALLARLERGRQAAEAHRALFDQIPVPAWVRDASGRIVICNLSYARLCEHPAETVIERGLELVPAGRQPDGPGLARAARTSGQPRVERCTIALKGERRVFAIHETPVELAELAPSADVEQMGSGTLGMALEVTEAEQLRAEVQRVQKSQAELLEALNTAVAIFGPDRRLRFFNAAWCQLWHMEERWAILRPTFQEVLERQRETRQLPEQADFRRYRENRLEMFTQLTAPHEELVHRPDGTTLRSLIVPDALGGLAFVQEDVTDRLQLESSFNTLIAVQRETLDNLSEAVVVFAPDGRVKLWNAVYAELFDLDPEALALHPHVREIIGVLEPYFVSADPEVRSAENFLQALFDRQDHVGRFKRSDGRSFTFAFRPLPDGAVMVTYTEITDTERVEQALRDRANALLEADRLKQKFLANISYQLRTPLNAISGFTEMLELQGRDTLNARQLGWLASTRAATNQLCDLVDSVLDLSLIEAGYLQVDRAPTDLDALMAELRQALEGEPVPTPVRLDFDIAPDLGIIEADGARLRQIVTHLMSNAVRAVAKGGRVELSARREGASFLLGLYDSAGNLPESELERLLRPFERGHDAHGMRGAGLGLTLVKSLVDLHNGRLDISSDPDSGTHIICRFPTQSGVPMESPENYLYG